MEMTALCARHAVARNNIMLLNNSAAAIWGCVSNEPIIWSLIGGPSFSPFSPMLPLSFFFFLFLSLFFPSFWFDSHSAAAQDRNPPRSVFGHKPPSQNPAFHQSWWKLYIKDRFHSKTFDFLTKSTHTTTHFPKKADGLDANDFNHWIQSLLTYQIVFAQLFFSFSF